MTAAPRARMPLRARPTVVASADVTTTTTVKEVADRDAFNELLKESSDKLVVVDYLTTWCGPCKLIAPKVAEMAEEYADKGVVVAKVTLDATDENKKWAMAIGIKSLPTFRLYKEGSEEHVAQHTGIKMDKLKALVDANLA